MRTPELRVNNYVGMNLSVLPDNIFKVSEVGSTMRVWQDKEIHYFDVDDLEPIPLTEEWLEKFGFKLIDMMFENVPMRYWRNDFIIVVDESKVVLLYNDKEIVTTVNVGYVHQLQNLFFCLTGRELELIK